MPAFRVSYADGSFDVVALDDLLERLHLHTDKLEITLGLIFEDQVQAKMRDNRMASISVDRQQQPNLPLVVSNHYAVDVEFNMPVEARLVVHASSVDEASQVVDDWFGGEDQARDKVRLHAETLVENLRHSVDIIERYGGRETAGYEIQGIVPISAPTTRQLT